VYFHIIFSFCQSIPEKCQASIQAHLGITVQVHKSWSCFKLQQQMPLFQQQACCLLIETTNLFNTGIRHSAKYPNGKSKYPKPNINVFSSSKNWSTFSWTLSLLKKTCVTKKQQQI